MVEYGITDLDFSKIYFYLPSVTDRSESENQYMKNINILPPDTKQVQLDAWSNPKFNPMKLVLFDVDKKPMTEAVLKCLKHIAAVSNSNLLRNAEGFLCRK